MLGFDLSFFTEFLSYYNLQSVASCTLYFFEIFCFELMVGEREEEEEELMVFSTMDPVSTITP